MEDTSYNLTNIKNFSEIVKYNDKPFFDDLFALFQYALTYNVNLNYLDTTTRQFSIREDCNEMLGDLLTNNEFEKFYNYLIIDITIDELYEKFKTIIEMYPSILMRKIRNRKIQATDFIFLDDYEMDETEREAWKNYRAQLRKITNDLQDDEIVFDNNGELNIVWPTIPNPNLLLINGFYYLL